MDTRKPVIVTPSRQAPALLAWALVVAFAAGFLQLFTDVPPWRFNSAIHLATDLSVAVGFGCALFHLASRRHLLSERRFWTLAFGAMTVFAGVQATDWLVGVGVMADDWLIDLPFWLLGSAMMFMALRGLSARRLEMRLWWSGAVLQLVFLACDFWEGRSLDAWAISAGNLVLVAKWSELIAIECYVVALILIARSKTQSADSDRSRNLRERPDLAKEMQDKAVFAAACLREGLPAPQTLLEGAGGIDGLKWHVARDQLDRDLLCKARSGNSSLGCLVFRRVAPNLFKDPDGAEVDLNTVLAWVDAYSRTTPAIVQPLLRNHPEVAGLAGPAEPSLVTARVFTCLNDEGRPVVAQALLRVPSALKPEWHRESKGSVPVDLDTGRFELPRNAGRRPASSGQAVESHVLTSLPAIESLALAAHRVFPHLLSVGWDIALTDDGPVLLEAEIQTDAPVSRRGGLQAADSRPLGAALH